MRWLYVLGAAAIIGVGIALFVVFDSSQPAPVDVSAARVVAAPFASYVAGTGITETGRGNIAVGSAVSGVVSAMLVRVGDRIAVGDHCSASTIASCRPGWRWRAPRSARPRQRWPSHGTALIS